MLSPAARAFLIWQVFDHVHRRNAPVRFVHLLEDLEDLAAWPGFRDAALDDPRFLVVGDAIDIATAGIHLSAPAEEIILQTLDLVEVPMPDQMLIRLVNRLRPDLVESMNPVDRALQTGQVLRPWTGHLARRHWLRGVQPVPLPLWLPTSLSEAAREVVRHTDGPVSAAGLAAALAERFDIPITEAYKRLGGDPAFLFLPGGTLALYDDVADEVSTGLESEYVYQSESDPDWSLGGGVSPAELPHDLVRRIIRICRETGRPISTGDIIRDIIGLSHDDTRYVATFRAVSARLGKELVPVGENRWYPSTMVPGEVWIPVPLHSPSQKQDSSLEGDVTQSKTIGRLTPAMTASQISIRLTTAHLEVGALSSPRLGEILSDQPILQLHPWSGLDSPVWYNAEHKTIYGLVVWLRQQDLQPGDTVVVTLRDGQLHGSGRQGVRLPSLPAAPASSRPNRSGSQQKALLPAITEILDRAGGSLERDQLMTFLNEEDPWITWTEVQPLFERLPILRYERGRCYLVKQLSGRRRSDMDSGVVRAELLGLLGLLPDEVRTDPRILLLGRLVASQPRVSAQDEALLLPVAQQRKGMEWERLVVGHLRYAFSYLLRRRDLWLLLPHVEDYFQHAAMGVMAAISRYDRSRASRLQNMLGWSVLQAISRERRGYLMPLDFPHHVMETLIPLLGIEGVPADGESEEAEAPDSPTLAEFWANVRWESWDEILHAYEEGELEPVWLTMGEIPIDPVDRMEFLDLSIRLHRLLDSLEPRTRDVLYRRFGLNGLEEETLEEISHRYGLTRERIRQIEARALAHLGKRRVRTELKGFLYS